MATDPLAEFDGRGYADPEQPEASEQVQDEPAAGDPADAGDTGGNESLPGTVPYNRYEETAGRVRELEARNDELMRMLLAGRQPQQQQDEDVADPDVERSVAPILNKRLQGVDKLLEKERRSEQMEQLEELSPGIGKMWKQIQAEFKSLPAHLQPDFDGPAGALALRARIEARPKTDPRVANDALKNRSHTEASPGTKTRGAPQLSVADINKMSRAEFDRFVAEMQNRGGRPSGEGYDPLIR